MKSKRYLKQISLAVCAILSIALLSACSPNKDSSSGTASASGGESSASSSELQNKTKLILNTVTARDYEAFINLFRPDFAEQLTVDMLSGQLDTILEPLGAFVEYTDEFSSLIQSDPTYGEVTVALQDIKYENSTATWGAVFDADGGLLSLTVQKIVQND